jgi:hypothetical protein
VEVAGTEAGALCVATVPVTGAADEAVAIMIPATIATMPPAAPATSAKMVQEEAGGVPGVGPSPVNAVPP